MKLDCAKARSKLDWQPVWNLDSALDKIVEWTLAYQKGQDVREVCLKQIDEYMHFEQIKPIKIKGEALSETIIKERYLS